MPHAATPQRHRGKRRRKRPKKEDTENDLVRCYLIHDGLLGAEFLNLLLHRFHDLHLLSPLLRHLPHCGHGAGSLLESVDALRRVRMKFLHTLHGFLQQPLTLDVELRQVF